MCMILVLDAETAGTFQYKRTSALHPAIFDFLQIGLVRGFKGTEPIGGLFFNCPENMAVRNYQRSRRNWCFNSFNSEIVIVFFKKHCCLLYAMQREIF